MSRRIVLLSDGTGNSSAKVWRTNVWRMFESIDLSGSDQIAYYDDGVGTSEFKPLAVIGGAFGYGLKRNVLDLYKFACRNFRHDYDEIYAFGFSRGAFTIRILIGLILEQGLIRADTEHELDRKARHAYREFRRENFRTNWPYYLRPEVWARGIRDLLTPNGYSKSDNRQVKNIRFVGLWDSVAAYGLPIDEMTRGVSQWIWPWQLPNCVLNDRVLRACHALSIDDERTTFHPILWDERGEAPPPEADGSRLIAKERISQVWFAGVHSNVGGGYTGQLARTNPADLDDERGTTSGPPGSRRRPSRTRKRLVMPSPHKTRMAKSPIRARAWEVTIASGRGTSPPSARICLRARTPRRASRRSAAAQEIHESVLHRIGNNAHLYAPIGLPARYDVVTTGGAVVEQPKFERLDQANSRIARQGKIWNLIWWRRLFYFATVAVTLWLLAFPSWARAARPMSS